MDAQNKPADIAVQNFKYCKFCGNKVAVDAVVCIHCGRQIEELKQSNNNNTQPIIINNSNVSTNTNNNGYMYAGRQKSKWVALLLCLFFGVLGIHKFYEGKIGMGILYLFSGGLFSIGVIIDFIVLLFKPNPYFVR